MIKYTSAKLLDIMHKPYEFSSDLIENIKYNVVSLVSVRVFPSFSIIIM